MCVCIYTSIERHSPTTTVGSVFEITHDRVHTHSPFARIGQEAAFSWLVGAGDRETGYGSSIPLRVYCIRALQQACRADAVAVTYNGGHGKGTHERARMSSAHPITGPSHTCGFRPVPSS